MVKGKQILEIKKKEFKLRSVLESAVLHKWFAQVGAVEHLDPRTPW
jgi:hypothetical protein